MYTLYYYTSEFNYTQNFQTIEEIDFDSILKEPTVKEGSKVVDENNNTVFYKHGSDDYELINLKFRFLTENLLTIKKGIYYKIDHLKNVIDKELHDYKRVDNAKRLIKDWKRDLEILDKMYIDN